jgi:hypothetical protein
MNLDHLIESLRDLPAPVIEQVQDYVDFLKTRHPPMTETAEDRFWALIEHFDQSAKTEESKFEPMLKALAKLDKAGIIEFIVERDAKLRSLDGPSFHEASGTGNSADGFLYARCAVITMGKKFYYKVLEEPSSFPQNTWAERLLYVGEEAFKKQFGAELDFFSGINYESFFNDELWGEGATFSKLGITPDAIEERATAR